MAQSRALFAEMLEARQMLASDWQNPFIARDVNRDGVVVPLDALLPINELNARTLIDENGVLPSRAAHPNEPFYDIDGDGFLVAADVLTVINSLNNDVMPPTFAIGLVRDTAPGGGANTDLLTSDARLSGKLTDELGVGFLQAIVDGGTPKTIAIRSDGTFEFDPRPLADGDHRVQLQASDGKQNAATSDTFVFQLDTAIPAPPASVALDPGSDSGNNADGVTRDNTPTINGDAPAGTVIQVFLGNQLVGQTTANSPWSVTTSVLPDGAQTLNVRGFDPAGNPSTDVSVNVTIDTTAPAAPTNVRLDAASDTGASSSDGITRDNTPTFLGGAEDGALVEALIGDQVVAQGTAASGWNMTTGALTDGAKTVTLRATDPAGNVSTTTVFNLTIDTAAPAVPIETRVDAASDSGASNSDGITNDNTPTIGGTAENGAVVAITLGGQAAGTANSNGTWSFTTAALTDGTKQLSVVATDLAGNSSAASAALNFTIDTAAPAAPLNLRIEAASDSGASNSDGITNDTTPTVTGSADNGATVAIALGGQTVGTVNSNGTWSFTTAALTDGAKQLSAIATDLAGNSSAASSTLSFTIDTLAPAAPTGTRVEAASDSGASNSDGITNDTTPTIGGSAEDGTVIAVTLDGQLAGTVNSNGTWSFTTAALADGAHGLSVTARDVAGNTSDASAALNFTIDTVLPASPGGLQLSAATDTGASNSDGVTRLATPTLIGTAGNGDVVSVRIAGNPVGQANSNGTWSFVFPSLADGTHDVTALVSDLAGNASSPSATFRVVIDTTPPAIPTTSLTMTSDTGTVGDGRTTYGRVTLVGQTDPNLMVRLLEQNLPSLANLSGNYQITGVSLAVGDNAFSVIASDLAGNDRSFQFTVNREAVAATADPVLTWNQAALDAIQRDATSPPPASRTLAMLHAAIFDAVNAIERKPSRFVALTAPAGASIDAAIAAAAHRVLRYAYPAQQAALDAKLATSLAAVANGQPKTDGIALGEAAGDAIIALRARDGFQDFEPVSTGTDPGDWQPTAPMFAPFAYSEWATLQPFAMTSPSQFRPAGPPALNSTEYAAAFNEVKSLGLATSTARTADQTQIARFWADGAGTVTPPGHWNSIASEIALAQGNSVADNARLFAQLNVAMADSAIAAWDAKRNYDYWRPVTAIQQAAADGNAATAEDLTWTSLIVTPPFPDYVSGHSTFSGAAARVLGANFGDNTTFTTGSPGLTGVTRNFTSFTSAANEAGRSRIFGGIHFEFANQDGLVAGRSIADFVLNSFSVSTDTTPPVIIVDATPNGASRTNVTLTGRVLDNLSGVASATIAIDVGAATPLTLDAQGRFTFTTTFATNGTQDGLHTITIRATDGVGLIDTEILALNLDTAQPAIVITAPVASAVAVAGDRLIGTVDGTGSTITALSYSIDGGTSRSLTVSGGAYNEPLDLSRLGIGSHTITVAARDAAGNTQTGTRTFSLAAATPLTISNTSPLPNSDEVGVTVRPRIDFSRPIDKTTLNADNYFASDAAGNKLPGTIIAANDGSFAWLFLRDPMPGASVITITVDGSTIRAADSTLLDADGNGTPGGTRMFSFTTVSRTDLPNTSIAGILADPGPDLKPGTRDDVAAGPDGVLMTADDVYLLPIAGAKIFILGREDQGVTTGTNGSFNLTSVPVGNVKLAVDGQTSTNAPTGFYFPEMVMDLNIASGQVNRVMAAMEPDPAKAAQIKEIGAYLPRLQTTLLTNVDPMNPTMIGVDAQSAPNLTPEQRSRLTIEILPGSLVSPTGQPLTNGQVGISTVPPELVRDMLPAGVLEHTFDITVQAPGISNFTTPAPMTFPNVFNAAPGTRLNFLSFDHATGRLVIEGTATVSADGLTVTTDPDTGITHPGWHGLTPPGDEGCGETPPRPPRPRPTDPAPTEVPPIALNMIFGETGTLSHGALRWNAPPRPANQPTAATVDPCAPPPPPPPQEESLTVKIEVDGPLGNFMKKAGNLDLVSQEFTLRPGAGSKEFKGEALNYAALFRGKFTELSRDVLYGSKIKVTERLKKADGSTATTIRTFLQYRWVDVIDATKAQNKTGDTAAFFRTNLEFGERVKYVDSYLPHSSSTKYQVDAPFDGGTPTFGSATTTWSFDPDAAGDITKDLQVKAVIGSNEIVVGTLKAIGKATAKTKLSVNQPSYEAKLREMVYALQARADGSVIYTSPAGTVEVGGARFLATFAGFLPANRGAGPTADPADDTWTGGDINTLLTREGNAMLAAVQADYADVATGIEVVTANAGADVTMTWDIEVLSLRSGRPIYGRADFDADTAFLQPLICTPGRGACVDNLSPAARQWALAQGLNQNAANSGTFAIAINNSWTSAASFAQFIANTVSHELGHTFGLIDSYLNGAVGASNDAGCGVGAAAGSNCKPNDIMRSGNDVDLDLTFASANIDLLKAALGIQRNLSQPLADALALYRDIFNLPGNTVGIRDELDLPPTPAIAVTRDGTYLFSGTTNSVGTVAADGAGNALASVGYVISNSGTANLSISAIALGGAAAGFTIVAPPALPLVLAPGASATLTIRFDPSAIGAATNRLTIISNAGLDPTYQLDVTGEGFSATAAARTIYGAVPVADPETGIVPAATGNNNLGGVPVAAGIARQDTFASVLNDGAATLNITGVRIAEGAASFRLLGVPADLATTPRVLARGEAFSFGVEFDPNAIGLARAIIEITTNDPANGTLRVTAVGTGLPEIVYPEWGNDKVAVEVNDNVVRVTSDGGGNYRVFLASDTFYHQVVFDQETGLVAHSFDITPPSGTNFSLSSSLTFGASTAPDSDGDGLPDDIELALGTGKSLRDTDRDGFDDFRELQLGLDPLGGRNFPTGIIAGLTLDGEAHEVALAPSPTNPSDTLAFVATGSYGLAVANVTQFDVPRLVGRINLLGDNVDVAYDAARRVAVVAGSTAGVHVVDVADPLNPTLLRTIALSSPAVAVQVYDGVAYVASGRNVVSIDLAAREVLQSIDLLGSTVTDLAREGQTLFGLDDAGRLRAVNIGDWNMTLRGTLTLANLGGKLFVGGDVAYVGAESSFLAGFSTVNVANPDTLVLISAPDNTSLPGRSVIANGSGGGIAVGSPANLGNQIALLNLSNPANTGVLVTQFTLPGDPNGAAIGAGIGFVADGSRGLQVVNYLAFDSGGQAPTATVTTTLADASPSAGFQILEGATVPIRVAVTDDVQVAAVRLIVNGSIVAEDVTFPFDFSIAAPAIAAGISRLNVQAEAVDSGGNLATSNTLALDLIPDTVPPVVVGSTPIEGSRRLQIPAISVRFNEPIDAARLALSGATLTFLGANGVVGGGDDSVVTLASIDANASRQVVVTPAAELNPGNYQLRLNNSIIADRAGNALAAPFVLNFTKRPQTTPLALNAINGEVLFPEDVFIYTISGTTGQRVLFDTIQGDGVYLTITSPSGVELHRATNSFSDTPIETLNETGVYRITVSSLNPQPQPFLFRLVNLNDQPVLPLDTLVGDGMFPVPSTAFTGLVGSYVNSSLRSRAAQDDWRSAGDVVISGTRNDTRINFPDAASFGARAPLGLTGGSSDADWDNFSVQWDGQVTVTRPDTIFYLNSDDGSRFWIDLNNDGVFAASGPELLPHRWGDAGSALSLASAVVQPGTYRIRVQYEEENGGNTAQLLWNQGGNIIPGLSSDVYRFNGTAGQRLFFDNNFIHPGYYSAYWTLYGPGNQTLEYARTVSQDFESTLPADGQYALVLSSYDREQPVLYQFRVVTPETTTTALTLGSTVSGTIAEPGEIHDFTFTGTVGLRLMFDALEQDSDQIFALLESPVGQEIWSYQQQNTSADSTPITLTDAGTYRLRIFGATDAVGDFKFRLLDIAAQPALTMDSVYGGTLTAVPSSALTGLSGSYIDMSLRDFVDATLPANAQLLNDWRGSQTIAGTRADADINFTTDGWGSRVAVGLSGGSDSNWDNFSVQWDGSVTISVADTHLYLANDDGARLLIDANNDGFLSPVDVLLGGVTDNRFGTYNDGSASLPSLALQPGTYKFRIQYEEGNGTNRARLLWDEGKAVTPAFAAQVVRFTGVADQRLFFDNQFIHPVNGYANHVLYDAGNRVVGQVSATSDLETTLPTAGDYLWVFHNYIDAHAVARQWEVVTPERTTTAISLETDVSGTIGEPGDEDDFTFAGTAGQRVYLNWLDADVGTFDSMIYKLISPTGDDVYYTGQSHDNSEVITLRETGTYRWRFDGNGDAEGDYKFRVLDVATAPVLALDALQFGTLTDVYRTELRRFEGVAGQRLFLDFHSGSTSSLYVQVIGPNDQMLFSRGSNSDYEVTLPSSGRYVVAIRADLQPTTDYDFTLELADTTSTALSGFGVATAGEIVHAGDHRVFTFSGTVGQRILYDSLEAEFDAINVVLLDPLGATHYSANSDSDSNAITLPQAGTYELVFTGSGDLLGDVNFQVHDLSAATAVTLGTSFTGTINSTADRGRESLLYRFPVTAGQRISFTSVNASDSNANWILVSPTNDALAATSITNALGDYTLPQTGTYTIVVSGATDSSTAIMFELLASVVANTPVTQTGFGVEQTGTVINNDVVPFTFEANAGALFYFDSLDRDFDAVNFELRKPDGSVFIGNTGASDDLAPRVLPVSGTYTLNILGFGDGDYRFRFLNLRDAPALALDTNIADAAHPATSAKLFQFAATSGQLLFLDATDTDNDEQYLVLYDANGTQITYYSASHHFTQLPSLPVGPIYVAISSNSAAATDYAFRLHDYATRPAQTFNATVTGTLNPGSSSTLTTFNGTNGDRLYLLGQGESTCGGYFELRRGTNGDSVTYNCFGNDFEITLPYTGPYVLAAVGYDESRTFDYSYQLITAETTTTALGALGTEISGMIADAGDQREFTFAGTPGQRLYYDALDTGFDAIYATLYGPGGQTVFSINSDSEFGEFQLSQAGTYRLVIDGYVRTTGDFRFRLLDAADAPLVALDTLTPFSLSEGTQTKQFRFAGTENQRVYFDFSGAVDCGATWTVSDSHADYVTSSNICNDLQPTLASTGEHLLTISASATGPLGASFRIVTPDIDVTPLVMGTTYGASFQFTERIDNLSIPVNVAFGADGRLYVADEAGGVYRFDGTTGAFIDRFIARGTNGINNIWGMAFGADGNLYLADANGGIGKFNGTTGASMGTFVASGSGGLSVPRGITFGPDGALYVASHNNNRIQKYDGTTGASLGAFVTSGSGGLSQPHSPIFGPDGKLYVASPGNNQVLRYDGTTGAFFDVFVSEGRAGLSRPIGLGFLPDGDLLVSGFSNNQVLRFAGATGAFAGIFASGGGLYGPVQMTFNGAGQLFVAARGNQAVMRYDASGGCVVDAMICEPGERDEYTFTGAIGQRLFYDAFDADRDSTYATLVSPSGSEQSISFYYYQTADYDSEIITLYESGTYRLRFRTDSERLGDYRFQLLDMASQPAIALDTPTTITIPPRQSVLYRLAGTAGQRLFVSSELLTASAFGGIELLDYYGDSLAGTSLGNGFDATIPATGEYYLLLDTSSNIPTDVRFTVVTPTTSTNPIAVSGLASGTISEPGEIDEFTFSGTVGQRILADILTFPNLEFQFQVFSPSGVNVLDSNRGFAAIESPITLEESGTFRVVVDPFDGSTGAYSFGIIDVLGGAPASVLTMNTPTNVLLMPGTSLRTFRFDAVTNQEITFTGTTPSNCSHGTWSVFGPGNQLLESDCQNTTMSLVAPGPGTYVLVVSGQQTSGSHAYSFIASTSALLADAPTSIAVGANLTSAALPRLVDAAIDRWSAAGLDRDWLSRKLRDVRFSVADLADGYLGLVAGDEILIDDDLGDFDLLTILAHEIGHYLGAPHADTGLMSDHLAPGERHLPTTADVDALFAAWRAAD